MIRSVRPWLKIIAFAFILIYHFLWVIVSSVFPKNPKRGFRIRRSFSRASLKAFGIIIHTKGNLDIRRGLVISNHRSLIDPLVELSLFDVYILSKAEVEKYPMIGKGARETGVLFVNRESNDSRKAILQTIERILLQGLPVLIYPEGTTKSEYLTSEFRKGSFEIAFMHKIPVVPVMIEYTDPSYYYADGSLLDYFKSIFSKDGKHHVYVEVREEISANSTQELIANTKQAIDEMIINTKKNF